MGKRHPNPRLVKLHRSYTVEQIARLFDIHKNTVRAWVKQGLQPIDGQRPALFHGPAAPWLFSSVAACPQSNPVRRVISIVCHAERQKHRPETWRNLCR
jgi:hypothetical protein